jgi:hypothetical protein
LTEDRRNQWQSYLQHLAAKMGVTDWSVEIKEGDPEITEAAASVRCISGRKIAWVNLRADWDDNAPDIQRHIATHELVHIHFEMSDDYVYYTLKDVLSETQAQQQYRHYLRLNEYGIDAVAGLIAPTMPLPEAIGIYPPDQKQGIRKAGKAK